MSYALLCLFLAASPARAGLNFGLGKATAKSAAVAVNKARESVAASSAAAPGATRLKWSFTIPETFNYSSPAIGSDGTVYFGASNHFVYYNGYWLQGQKPPAKTNYGLF